MLMRWQCKEPGHHQPWLWLGHTRTFLAPIQYKDAILTSIGNPIVEIRRSYGISYTGKMASLYWIRALVSAPEWLSKIGLLCCFLVSFCLIRCSWLMAYMFTGNTGSCFYKMMEIRTRSGALVIEWYLCQQLINFTSYFSVSAWSFVVIREVEFIVLPTASSEYNLISFETQQW